MKTTLLVVVPCIQATGSKQLDKKTHFNEPITPCHWKQTIEIASRIAIPPADPTAVVVHDGFLVAINGCGCRGWLVDLQRDERAGDNDRVRRLARQAIAIGRHGRRSRSTNYFCNVLLLGAAFARHPRKYLAPRDKLSGKSIPRTTKWGRRRVSDVKSECLKLRFKLGDYKYPK